MQHNGVGWRVKGSREREREGEGEREKGTGNLLGITGTPEYAIRGEKRCCLRVRES